MGWRAKIITWGEAAGASAAMLWGNVPTMVQCLIILMALDIVGGYIVAAQRHDASSKPIFKGITKKVFVLILIGAAYLIWRHMGIPVAEAITGGYCVWEFKSLLEKAALLGIPLPAGLLRMLRVMNEKYQVEPPPKQEQDGNGN